MNFEKNWASMRQDKFCQFLFCRNLKLALDFDNEWMGGIWIENWLQRTGDTHQDVFGTFLTKPIYIRIHSSSILKFWSTVGFSWFHWCFDVGLDYVHTGPQANNYLCSQFWLGRSATAHHAVKSSQSRVASCPGPSRDTENLGRTSVLFVGT